jgi:hypothetical protein
MPIRAKLYAAIVLTVLGPIVTIAVALHGQAQLGDRFDEVRERARHEALARELKFGVTDGNGWQTAYGYDDGASRPRFERSVAAFRSDLNEARRTLNEPREQTLVRRLNEEFNNFMALDAVAFRALESGREAEVRRIFLGPELDLFESMAATSERLAQYEESRAAAAERAFGDTRDDARKRLILVALGAGLVIVLLLLTASDVVRLALEGERRRPPSGVGQ